MTVPLNALSGIPAGLRTPLLDRYREICRNFAENRWEPSELNAGKFCEVVYRVLEGYEAGRYAARPTKPRNFVAACRTLENNTSSPRSFRILIPRFLPALYEVRNNRGVGHVGGDVNPNHMDATAVVSMAQWVMCELVRVFHGLATDEAQDVVDALVDRRIPIIWEVDGVKRVLDPTFASKDQTLLLLYAEAGAVTVNDLVSWIEYSRAPMFRRRVLAHLHEERLIEFNQRSDSATLSPRGALYVEDELLTTL